ncbi:MAG: RdgB/HAM1 family non-canonical purine NTP pyrophosphatase [Ruminococcaceae bacterium]|nr:RdgB/HAM1 family non-canonical purine NTP pyrophosphatase [Oscillospiraceae bacterium]
MIQLVLASRNRKKIAEFETILKESLSKDIQILSLDDIGFHGEIEENGTTFEQNAFIKASVPASMGYIGIADDSGLTVDHLDGRPGVYSARYSGKGDAENNKKILREMEGVPEEKRTAHFVCAVSCVFPDKREPLSVLGICDGLLLTEQKGDGGFGYDPLFFFPSLGKTFAELTPEEKNAISHRGIAVREFSKQLQGIL